METVIKTNSFRNYPYSFTDNSSRVFYCNAIVFINQGTSNVFINDIFTLLPFASLKFSGNQNEVDETVYKIAFASGGVNLLNVWTKEDAGQHKYNIYPKDAFYTKNASKRGQDAQRNGHGPVKGQKDNKYNNKLRGDF